MMLVIKVVTSLRLIARSQCMIKTTKQDLCSIMELCLELKTDYTAR